MTENDYPGGSHRFEHGHPVRREMAPHSSFREALKAMLIETFGKPTRTFADPEDDAVDLVVHAVPPAAGARHWTLFTLGMSDREMKIPYAEMPNRRAELVLRLPPSWDPDARKTGIDWALAELLRVAKLPHRYQTGLVLGDTISNGDPPTPFSKDTRLCCWLLIPPDVMEDMVLRPARDIEVHVMGLYALHASELRLKLREGLIPLMQSLRFRTMSPVLDLNRPPAMR